MQHLEVSGAVRPLYGSLGVKGLTLHGIINDTPFFRWWITKKKVIFVSWWCVCYVLLDSIPASYPSKPAAFRNKSVYSIVEDSDLGSIIPLCLLVTSKHSAHKHNTLTLYIHYSFYIKCFGHTYWPSWGRHMQVQKEKCCRRGLTLTISVLTVHEVLFPREK